MPQTKLETIQTLLKEAEEELVEIMERIQNLKLIEQSVMQREDNLKPKHL